MNNAESESSEVTSTARARSARFSRKRAGGYFLQVVFDASEGGANSMRGKFCGISVLREGIRRLWIIGLLLYRAFLKLVSVDPSSLCSVGLWGLALTGSVVFHLAHLISAISGKLTQRGFLKQAIHPIVVTRVLIRFGDKLTPKITEWRRRNVDFSVFDVRVHDVPVRVFLPQPNELEKVQLKWSNLDATTKDMHPIEFVEGGIDRANKLGVLAERFWCFAERVKLLVSSGGRRWVLDAPPRGLRAPDQVGAGVPAVIHLPCGGWCLLSPDENSALTTGAILAYRYGIACFVVHFGRAPECKLPEVHLQCERVFHALTHPQIGSCFGIDVHRIGIVGESAGATEALGLSLELVPKKVRNEQLAYEEVHSMRHEEKTGIFDERSCERKPLSLGHPCSEADTASSTPCQRDHQEQHPLAEIKSSSPSFFLPVTPEPDANSCASLLSRAPSNGSHQDCRPSVSSPSTFGSVSPTSARRCCSWTHPIRALAAISPHTISMCAGFLPSVFANGPRCVVPAASICEFSLAALPITEEEAQALLELALEDALYQASPIKQQTERLRSELARYVPAPLVKVCGCGLKTTCAHGIRRRRFRSTLYRRLWLNTHGFFEQTEETVVKTLSQIRVRDSYTSAKDVIDLQESRSLETGHERNRANWRKCQRLKNDSQDQFLLTPEFLQKTFRIVGNYRVSSFNCCPEMIRHLPPKILCIHGEDDILRDDTLAFANKVRSILIEDNPHSIEVDHTQIFDGVHGTSGLNYVVNGRHMAEHACAWFAHVL